MEKLERLGLGCMGMSKSRNMESSIKTIHTALNQGITLLNTGEFYQQGDSEMIVGEAIKGIRREDYFLSVKFGVLPAPEGGIYGLDVDPSRIKAHLVYSLRRLGLDYVDLYQPARMDTAIPVEEIIGSMSELVKTGFIKNIGLSMVDADTLRRAHKVYPIHTVEMEYSLINRDIEKELIATAKELGVKVLAFGTAGHGLLTDKIFEQSPSKGAHSPMFSPDNFEKNIELVKAVKEIADKKDVTLSELAIAWSLAKYDHVQSLIGTTNPEHLLSAINSTKIVLTQEEIMQIEEAIPEEKIAGRGMRNLIFTNGKMSLAK